MSNKKQEEFYIKNTQKDFAIPSYQTKGSSGMDLYANITSSIIILPGERILVDTGIRIALPVEYEAQIRPRSGLALKYGVTLLNSPGTVDSDYRGAIKVIMINHGREPYKICRGDRIAQMVIVKIEKIVFKEVDFLDETTRANNGFGHTGFN